MAADGPRLAIVIPERGVITESFIQSHIDGLYADRVVVWGSPRPLYHGEGDGMLSGVWSVAAATISFATRIDRVRALGAVGRRLPKPAYDRSLARFFGRVGIDVVLAEYGTMAVEVMDACSLSGIPLVVHFHGYDAYKHEVLDRFRKPYERLFQVASRVVAVSNHMHENLLENGSPPERTVCNPYGVDIGVFHAASPREAPPMVLTLGRFVEKKAPTVTLRAFARVRSIENRATLVMLGDGPLREKCIDLANELGVERQVEFPGMVSHDEVAGWMRRARCFAQHSLTPASGDSEGTPVAILEASACGLPVVSTRHGGIVDAVVDGTSGFLVDEGDVESMAARMLELIRSPGLAGQMGEAGRRHIAKRYSAERSLSRLRRILVEAAGPAG